MRFLCLHNASYVASSCCVSWRSSVLRFRQGQCRVLADGWQGHDAGGRINNNDPVVTFGFISRRLTLAGFRPASGIPADGGREGERAPAEKSISLKIGGAAASCLGSRRRRHTSDQDIVRSGMREFRRVCIQHLLRRLSRRLVLPQHGSRISSRKVLRGSRTVSSSGSSPSASWVVPDSISAPSSRMRPRLSAA